MSPLFSPFRFWKSTLICLLLASFLISAPASDLPKRQEITVLSPGYTRYLEICEQARRLREAEDMDGLDALAAELRASKEAAINGTWRLSGFYEQIVVVPKGDPVETEAAMRFYQRWATEKPESITAQICLAEAYVDYAWIARGSGYADTVTPEGSRLMDERLSQAWGILQKAALLQQKCPHWTVVAQTVALGQGWARKRYLKMTEEAISQEPTYAAYYKQACYWLLPRWYGETGDFEKWIEKMADAHPEKDKQYARLLWQVDSLGMPEEMSFGPGQLDWPRAKRGFAIWLREMPDSLPLRFEILHLALLANDRETARAQFDVTGGKYWPADWHRRPDLFEAARHFAYDYGQNPLLASEHASDKARSADPRIVNALGVSGHVIGGVLAALFCFILALQRKQTFVGILLLLIFPVLTYLYGTIAAAVPSFIYVLYLRSKEPADLPERPPQRWGTALAWVICILFFDIGAQFIATVLVIIPRMVASGYNPAAAQTAASEIFSSGVGFTIALNAVWLSLLFLFAICGRQTASGWQQLFGWYRTAWGKAIVCVLVGLAVVAAANFLIDKLKPGSSKEVIDLMKKGVHSPLIFFFTLAFLGPILEELLLRGYAYSRWLPKFGFFWTALITSIIFTLAHIQYEWVGLLQIFCMGVVLVWLRRKTGSILPCLALHMMINLIFCLIAFFEMA